MGGSVAGAATFNTTGSSYVSLAQFSDGSPAVVVDSITSPKVLLACVLTRRHILLQQTYTRSADTVAVFSGDIDLFSTASVSGGVGINPDSPSLETGGSADVFVVSVFKFAIDAVSGRISAGSTTCASNYVPPRYQVCSKQGDYGDFNGQMFSRARAKLSNPKIFGR